MRRLIITIIFILTTIYAIGQSVKIERATEEKLLISPHGIDEVRTFTDSSYIMIKLIEMEKIIANHPDNFDEDAIFSDFLLLVRERFDDKPNSSANFWVKGQFYNPRDYKFKKVDRSLTFRHGTDTNVKSTTLYISAGDIKVK
jgi:hypothetical protein